MSNWIDERYIEPGSLEKRDYQINIANRAAVDSTLVVLPTGMGKTIIALLVVAHKLDEGNILFLAPTKPLAQQHYEFLIRHLTIDPDDILLFTGEISPKKRRSLWAEKRIIISTPQVVRNDIISGVKTLDDISLIVFDEAHRGVGKYAYGFIAEKYASQKENGLVLGMTASPGSEAEHIHEVCGNLFIDKLELRSKWDKDVRPYVHEIKMSWIKVDLPENMRKINKNLEAVLNKKIDTLKTMSLLKGKRASVKNLLELQRIILARLHAEGKQAPKHLYQALSLQAQAMKINHALELLTTQGMEVLNNYFDKLKTEARQKGSSKASRILVNETKFKYAMAMAKFQEKVHPKVPKVCEAIQVQFVAKEDSRIILFTQYRGSAEVLLENLMKIPGVRPEKFVGQRSTGTDRGLKQKEQIEVIKRFRAGDVNVLIATSVAEEGLDIPSTDLVIFYEPVPSEIRSIQRRGRTGRKREGKVIIMMTKGTRDEAYYWTSMNKEKRMMREIEILRKEFKGGFVSYGKSVGNRHQNPKEDGLNKNERTERKTRSLDPYEWRPEEKGAGTSSRVSGAVDTSRTSDGGTGQTKIDDRKTAGDRHMSQDDRTSNKASDSPDYDRTPPNQTSLGDFSFSEESIEIVVDNREFNSEVVKELSRMDVIVTPKHLEVGDYVISSDVAVERKKVSDFLSSMLDNYLFLQLKKLKAYQNPVLIIEGDNLFSTRNISDEAIFGALSAITMGLGVSIVMCKDSLETAKFLVAGAKRERRKGRPIKLRGGKAAMSLREQQQYILEGLPGISAKLAQRLLSHFKSVIKVMNATEGELAEVKGIGKILAKSIREAVDTDYKL